MWSSMPIFSFLGYTLGELFKKTWQLTTNLKTNKFDILYIIQCVEKKKLLVRHNMVAK